MSLLDTTTFIRMFCLCGLVWSIGILWHTHTLPCDSLWFHVEHWLLVDNLWITLVLARQSVDNLWKTCG